MKVSGRHMRTLKSSGAARATLARGSTVPAMQAQRSFKSAMQGLWNWMEKTMMPPIIAKDLRLGLSSPKMCSARSVSLSDRLREGKLTPRTPSSH